MNIQLLIGILILAGALFFIGKRTFNSFTGKGNHGSCADCAPLDKALSKDGDKK